MPTSSMETSPTVEAARDFLATVWEGRAPSDAALLAGLDRIILAYHRTPHAEPSETDLEAPRVDGPTLYQEVAARFPAYRLYPVSDPSASFENAVLMGDSIDDLADLTLDMREVVWLAEHIGVDDAHWSFRAMYFHWGRHARELALYLHARQFG